MQIGDQVRFLNEVGGGKITGFQGKNIVLVEDEDGFDIPMLRSQVVVVETNANNFEIRKKNAPMAVEAPTVRYLEDGVDDDPSARPISYQALPQERKGGDILSVCLAFVPEDARELSRTRFKAFLVNDSNYFIHAVYSSRQGEAWHLRWEGTIEPNTKQLLEVFDRDILNEIEYTAVQLIAWKQDKEFQLQPPVDVQLHVDTVKFYKLHAFRPSPFFREAALVYALKEEEKSGLLEEEEVETAMEVEAIPEPDVPPVPIRSREEEREALKAAKRQLKEEERQRREKEQAQREERNPHFSKPNYIPAKEKIIEVDLHINALLDHTEGLSPSVLLNTQLTEFRIMMDRNMKKKGQRIVFIHGKGEGVLREALIKELQHRYRSCTYEDASFQKYGFGATMVTIR